MNSAKYLDLYVINLGLQRICGYGRDPLLHASRPSVTFALADHLLIPCLQHDLTSHITPVSCWLITKHDRITDQQDAYATTKWLSESDERGILSRYFDPPLTDRKRRVAELGGWILGIA